MRWLRAFGVVLIAVVIGIILSIRPLHPYIPTPSPPATSIVVQARHVMRGCSGLKSVASAQGADPAGYWLRILGHVVFLAGWARQVSNYRLF